MESQNGRNLDYYATGSAFPTFSHNNFKAEEIV
jgi:hypothetical protein